MGKIRFYNDNVGPIDTAEKKAFAKALDICSANEIDLLIILISTKKTDSYLERIFNIDDAKDFHQGIKVNHVNCKIETKKTIKNCNSPHVVLALGVDSTDLFNLEDHSNVYAIVGHQWQPNGIEQWAMSTQALNIDTNEANNLKEIDPIVEIALKELTDLINLSTGINHNSDNERCKSYLRALYKNGNSLDETSIYRFLTKELKWSSKHSMDAVEIVHKLNSKKKFNGGDKSDFIELIDRWDSKLV